MNFKIEFLNKINSRIDELHKLAEIQTGKLYEATCVRISEANKIKSMFKKSIHELQKQKIADAEKRGVLKEVLEKVANQFDGLVLP